MHPHVLAPALVALVLGGPSPSDGQEGPCELLVPRDCRPHQDASEDEPAQTARVSWFEGSFDELLAESKRSDKLVFVDFWAAFCGPCRMFAKNTLRDPGVVGQLDGMLCYSVELDGETENPIAARFGIETIPAVVFLEPDGDRREVLIGYRPPKVFRGELDRIRENRETLSDYHRRIAANPNDLEARYALVVKYKALGKGGAALAEAESDEILRLDPTGRSVVARRIRLDRLVHQIWDSLDPLPIYRFLEGEPDPGIRFQAWYAAWQVEGHLAKNAETADRAERHRRAWVSAARSLWEVTPDERRPRIGNNIAWNLYECSSMLGYDDLGFALAVATEVARLTPEDANVIDTLACCLHAVGREEDALRNVRRCIELQPDNPEWKRRLQEFLR